MPFREIISIYCENCAKHTYTRQGKCQVFDMIREMEHLVITVLCTLINLGIYLLSYQPTAYRCNQ